ncbi:cell division protein FtsZ [Amorphus orientalis]|uniref:Cell division protein FtsZ n=1 Tax=Amorphus orientalis TaxID=649198 RepID=A0AAE3VNQ4_9HYPH|nr:cell division protein FtsZ [Amorphus orientalis]MDQ0315320.1 cell division protein FtsZ [Amorphus orientalis]
MPSINLKTPDLTELKPRIQVFGVGGAGCNAVNNMIQAGLQGCDFLVANTDAQSLSLSKAERIIQMGIAVTEGLGAGSQPDVGRAAAEEVIDEIADHLSGAHMAFITAGMGGGTGTGAAPVIARAARDQGILTVGVVTKPFQFEGHRRMKLADSGIEELSHHVDTLIVIPNQNLFRIANERTTFADAFAMADQVLYSGVACITDLMVKEGLINLDFADVRSIMRGMGKAMMGTGEASGEGRAMQAAEAAISNPLLDETSMKGARGLLVSVTGGMDLTLFEVDEATTRIREEVDPEANIIFGATFDESLDGMMRVSVVATGIDKPFENADYEDDGDRVVALSERLRHQAQGAGGGGRPRASAVKEATLSAVAQDLGADLEAEEADEHEFAAEVEFEADQVPFDAADELIEEEEDFAFEAEDEIEAREPVAPVQPQPVEKRSAAPTRVPRMPEIEEVRPAAPREVRRRDDHSEADDRRPMGLLRRLANGLGRRDEDDADVAAAEQAVARARSAPAPEEAPAPAPAPAPRAAPRAEAQPQAPRRVQEGNEFARRSQPQRPQGESYRRPRAAGQEPEARTRPAARPQSDDDQLEIPAFLRRQAT